jgi:hypothetical protein
MKGSDLPRVSGKNVAPVIIQTTQAIKNKLTKPTIKKAVKKAVVK